MHPNEDRMKSAKGKRDFLKYAEGEMITPMEGIRAKCYDCQAFFEDIAGVRDCGVKTCPLYPFNPYSSDRSQNKPAQMMQERIKNGEFVFSGFKKKTAENPSAVSPEKEDENMDEEEMEKTWENEETDSVIDDEDEDEEEE